ncbi:MAG TPA: YraN family protein [Luteitalea sp.]|nr:YraN family protein [Luteitalea sp.]
MRRAGRATASIPLPAPPDDPRQHLGTDGEAAAADALIAAGYVVLERRFRCAYGEIDLVCRHADALVFVEVKTRRDEAFGGGAAAVTWRKQRTIVRVAQTFLARGQLHHLPCRFDVVVVSWPQGAPPRTHIIPAAFDAG